MATLGYEVDTTITKTEVASVQLIEAIDLFLAGKFLCAITLAGASEEILARLLNARGDKSIVEDSFGAIQHIREVTGITVMDGRPRNEIFNKWNSARNSLKHHGKADDEALRINLFDEAFWMIKRALVNAEKLNVSIRNQLDFENWVIVNINM